MDALRWSGRAAGETQSEVPAKGHWISNQQAALTSLGSVTNCRFLACQEKTCSSAVHVLHTYHLAPMLCGAEAQELVA